MIDHAKKVFAADMRASMAAKAAKREQTPPYAPEVATKAPAILVVNAVELAAPQAAAIQPPALDSSPVAGLPFPEGSLTDTRAAELVASRHSNEMRYVPERHKWLAWDGKRWATQPDSAAIAGHVVSTARYLQEQAVTATATIKQRQDMVSQAMRLEADGRIRDVVARIQDLPTMRVSVTSLDNRPHLLNVANGTVDLKTGALLPHRREDLLTQLTESSYDAGAECPHWQRFLQTTFMGDADLIRYVQCIVGYTLTGIVSERALFILHGSGRNGKSVFLEALCMLLGDYAAPIDPEALLSHRDARHPADFAALRGIRLAYAQETAEGRRMNEPLVKALTGGDTITVRGMRQDPYPMKPQFKLWMATNSKPLIYEQGYAIWDRVKLIPFRYRVADNEQIPQHVLLSRFKAEAAGILRWAVEGCIAYLRDGLTEPQTIKDETATYRNDMDTLGGFIVDACDIRADYFAPWDELYRVYVAWCQSNGETADGGKVFGRKLAERGHDTATKRQGSKTTKARLGLQLKALHRYGE